MKKSELLALIEQKAEEKVIEMLPDLISMIKEDLSSQMNAPSLTETSIPQSGEDQLSLIRKRYRETNSGGGGYDSLGLPKLSTKPNNPKAVVNGETFASGKGIMEWFGKSQSTEANTKIQQRESKMQNFMEKKFGVK